MLSLLDGRIKIDTRKMQRGAENVVSQGARAAESAAAAATAAAQDAKSAVQRALRAPPRHMSAFSVEGERAHSHAIALESWEAIPCSRHRQ